MKNIVGKWQIACLVVIQKSGRQVVKKYAAGECVWEIMPENILIEHAAGHPPRHLGYRHAHNILLVERPSSLDFYYADLLHADELLLSDPANRTIIEAVRIIK